jgi:flagellar protein FliS
MAKSYAVDRYKAESVTPMSPAAMVVALYDRLLLDFDRAQYAFEMENMVAVHAALVHAQEILGELHDSLDLDAWPAAATIADIYRYVIDELIRANLAKDPAPVADCRQIIEPLRDAWREAAAVVPGVMQ